MQVFETLSQAGMNQLIKANLQASLHCPMASLPLCMAGDFSTSLDRHNTVRLPSFAQARQILDLKKLVQMACGASSYKGLMSNTVKGRGNKEKKRKGKEKIRKP
eukprot:scaffold51178_cov24-Tisochrysis_lutea.AAC.1